MAANLPDIPSQSKSQTKNQNTRRKPPPILRSDIPPNPTILTKMARDIKNFKNLPQDTTLKKLDSCFMADNRVYVTISIIVAFLIILLVIILICLGSKKSKKI
jgi:hypothetical protein